MKQFTITSTIAVKVAGGPYAADDVLGGLLTFSEVVNGQQKSGEICKAIVRDKLNTGGNDVDLYLFNENPSLSTFTDNAQLNINNGDLSKLIGAISCSVNYSASSANKLSQALFYLCLPINLIEDKLYVVPVLVNGTPTYADDDLSLELTIRKD